MRKIFLILVLIIVSVSCKKADAEAECYGCLYFGKPQPENDSELIGFPSRFKGLYVDKDSTFLRIEEDRILKEYFFKNRFHKSFLDSLKDYYNIVNGQLIEKETLKKYSMIEIGDSLEISRKDIDTIFRFSYNQKAKIINSHIVISNRDSIFWRISIISLQKNILKMKYIYFADDVKKIDSVTKIKGQKIDSLSYLLKPTRSEFRKILKIKNLGREEEYNKISKID
ncbi:hypothetical protein [Flavobacterium ginsenosidimutans]|uniref:hypothetical protein n=1 Tax=Flavobacterium ginsenosidimutans TaxID=687844 RepID=UPI000DAE3874|nr:hypothetical protein [Flavobacterium ginsenosidimutans]KAF2331751.1 hypothetical protein DM444_11150 [Flavobacterium ginsenosidimutans]